MHTAVRCTHHQMRDALLQSEPLREHLVSLRSDFLATSQSDLKRGHLGWQEALLEQKGGILSSFPSFKGDGSVAESTSNSSRGPTFNSQNSCGSSQPSGTSVGEDPMSSSDLHGPQAGRWCTDIYADSYICAPPFTSVAWRSPRSCIRSDPWTLCTPRSRIQQRCHLWVWLHIVP